MFTLTNHDRQILGQNQQSINELTQQSLAETIKLDNPQLSEAERNEAFRKIEGISKNVSQLATQNEAIIQRAYADYKRILDSGNS